MLDYFKTVGEYVGKIRRNLMSDKLKARGIFSVKVYENGELIEDYKEDNVIVVTGRTQLVKLLANDVTGRSITKIGFGENGATAAATDTALSGTAFIKSFPGGSVTYPSSTSVQFSWTLENAEGNGLAITEFGLITTDGTLFSRKQRSVINKTSSIRLVGTWTIQL